MTELQRAKEALTAEIGEFVQQTKLLTGELNEAAREHENAHQRLMEHTASHEKALEEFYAAVEDAETAEHEARLAKLG